MSWKDEIGGRYKDASQGAKATLSVGSNVFRLLCAAEAVEQMLAERKPYKDLLDKPRPYAEFRCHYNVGPKRQGVQNIHACGKDVDGQGECWICDVLIPQLLNSNVPAKRAQAQAMAAKVRMVVLISMVDRDTGRFGAPKPLFMDYGGGKSLYIRILSLLKETRCDYEDPDRGYNVSLERIGQGQGTTWMAPMPDPKPTRVPPQLLKAIKPLESYLYAYSKAEQEAAYNGRPAQDNADDQYAPEPVDDQYIQDLSDPGGTGEYVEPEPTEEELAGGEGEGQGEYADQFAPEGGDDFGDYQPEPEPEPAPPPRRPAPKQTAPPPQQRRGAPPPPPPPPQRRGAPPAAPPRATQRPPAQQQRKHAPQGKGKR